MSTLFAPTRLSLDEALELDARGGDKAWERLDEIVQTLEQAHALQPDDLELAARLFNLYVPGLMFDEISQLLARVLQAGPVDEETVTCFLLPGAAALIDITRPRQAKLLLDVVPACWRSGERWQALVAGLEKAQARDSARDQLQALRHSSPLDPEKTHQRAQQLRRIAWPPYKALAWPLMNRYPDLEVARGVESAEEDPDGLPACAA